MSKCILVVEDVPDDRRILRDMLAGRDEERASPLAEVGWRLAISKHLVSTTASASH
jgi:hypothetical protein